MIITFFYTFSRVNTLIRGLHDGYDVNNDKSDVQNRSILTRMHLNGGKILVWGADLKFFVRRELVQDEYW